MDMLLIPLTVCGIAFCVGALTGFILAHERAIARSERMIEQARPLVALLYTYTENQDTSAACLAWLADYALPLDDKR